jgi:hypothetical protein
MTKFASPALGLIALMSLVGCNETIQSEKVHVTGAENKTFALTYPKEVTVRPGESAKVDVKIDRHNFDETVALTVSQLPEGVSVAESSPVIPKGSNMGSFTLKAADNSKPEKGAEFKLSANAAGVQAGPYAVRIDVAEKGGAAASADDKSKSTDDKHAVLKEELRKSTKAKLDSTDAAIKTLEEHSKTATGDAKKDIDKELDSLRSKRDDLQKRYDKIETTGPSAWDEFKNDVSKAADDLGAATKRALDRFKK